MNQVADSGKLNFRLDAAKSLIYLQARQFSHIMRRGQAKKDSIPSERTRKRLNAHPRSAGAPSIVARAIRASGPAAVAEKARPGRSAAARAAASTGREWAGS